MITASRDQKGIIVAITGAAALVFFGRWIEGRYGKTSKDATGAVVGAAVVLVVLAFAADVAPQIAKPLAALIFFAALFRYGPEIFNATTNKEKGKHK